MYLSENKHLRLFTLCGLYVAQGIPWGFVAIALKAWLAGDPNNLSEGQLGDLLAYATLPWSFKWLWGFVVDSVRDTSMGRRRPWIIVAQLTMLICLGAIAFTADPKRTFDSLLILVLLANVFVGLQDVAVDAMAVDLLTDDDRERVSGLMYGSNYLGTAIGGAGLGWVIGRFGLQAAVGCQCVLLSISMLLPILVRERPGDRFWFGHTNSPGEDGHDVSEVRSGKRKAVGSRLLQLARDLLRAFSLRATLIGAVVALLVRIGYGMLTPVFTKYLRSAAGWTTEQYTEVEGLWGSLAGLSACFIGAFAAQRFGAKRVTAAGLSGLSMLWITVGVQPDVFSIMYVPHAVIVLQEALLALVTVGLFAIYCAISWPRVAAIQFTAYMAMLNFSTTIGSKLAGTVSDRFSMAQMFIAAGLVQFVLMGSIFLIDQKQTRRVLGDF